MTSAVSFRGGRSEQASVGAATIGQRRRAGVIILIVGGGGISLGATHLGDGDVVDHAAAIRVAIAEVQVGDEAGLALADWVGQGDLEGAGGGRAVKTEVAGVRAVEPTWGCLLYTSPSPRDRQKSRMPSSA